MMWEVKQSKFCVKTIFFKKKQMYGRSKRYGSLIPIKFLIQLCWSKDNNQSMLLSITLVIGIDDFEDFVRKTFRVLAIFSVKHLLHIFLLTYIKESNLPKVFGRTNHEIQVKDNFFSLCLSLSRSLCKYIPEGWYVKISYTTENTIQINYYTYLFLCK